MDPGLNDVSIPTGREMRLATINTGPFGKPIAARPCGHFLGNARRLISPAEHAGERVLEVLAQAPLAG